jgi:hypothetical protein
MSFKDKCAGIKLSWNWVGEERSVEPEFTETFREETASAPSATVHTKRIINPKNEYYRKLTVLRSKVTEYFRSATFPYVERGVRICARDKAEAVIQNIKKMRAELKVEEASFETHRGEVLEDCELFLGKLYNPSNYPATFVGVFDVSAEPFSLEVPPYYKDLNPEGYEQLQRKMEERVEISLKKHDQYLQELVLKLTETLADKLKPNPDGTKKRLESSAVDNVHKFLASYQEFRGLSKGLREDTEVDGLIGKLKEAIGDHDAEEVRGVRKLRERLATAVGEIAEELGKRVVAKKRKVEFTPAPVISEAP